MEQKNPLRPVFVIWEDAFSIDEWTNIEDLKEGPSATVHSCGLLVEETPKQIILTLNYDTSNDNVSCVMVIPKDMVRAIIHLDNET